MPIDAVRTDVKVLFLERVLNSLDLLRGKLRRGGRRFWQTDGERLGHHRQDRGGFLRARARVGDLDRIGSRGRARGHEDLDDVSSRRLISSQGLCLERGWDWSDGVWVNSSVDDEADRLGRLDRTG